jgi:hypothetical protein
MGELWTWSEIVFIVPVDGRETTARNPLADADVTGWSVEATDGHIGKVGPGNV